MKQTKPFVFIRSHGNVTAYLDRLVVDVPRAWGDVMHKVGEVYLQAVKDATPVGTPSGDPRRQEPFSHLKDAWFMQVVEAGPDTKIIIRNANSYLSAVTGGRRAIDRIKEGKRYWDPKARGGKGGWRGALLFYVGGRPLYRWRVKAVAPNPFHRRAVAQARRQAETVLHREVAAVIRKIGVVESSTTSGNT